MATLLALLSALSCGWFYANQPHGKPCMGEVRRVAAPATLSSGVNSPA